MSDNIQMPSDVGSEYNSNVNQSSSVNLHGLCAGLIDIKQSIKDVGKSAYEIAVKNGFDGTEEEWLNSLHGKDGMNAEDSVVIRFSQDSCLFMGTAEHAIAASISINITATIGTKKNELTVGNILDTPTGMGVVIENNNTTDVTLKINVDETMTSHGVLNIPITVNDILYAKGLSYAIAFQGLGGLAGTDGRGISNITQYYLVSDKSDGIKISDSGWVSGDIPLMTEIHKYLWEYEVILYTDNSSEIIQPKVVGIYSKGIDGKNGVSINNVVNYYLATPLSTGVTIDNEGWTQDPQSLTEENRYLWNYESVIYSDNTSTSTIPTIIGMYSKGDPGEKGDPGQDGESSYYVVLGNENFSIPCTEDLLVENELIIDIPVYSYLGTEIASSTIALGTLPTGISASITNGTKTSNGNIRLTVSDSSNLDGNKNGNIDVNINIEGQTFVKKISWIKVSSGKSPISIIITSNNGNTFKQNTSIKETVLTCFVYKGGIEITPNSYDWYEWSGTEWVSLDVNTKSITISVTDINDIKRYKCAVDV